MIHEDDCIEKSKKEILTIDIRIYNKYYILYLIYKLAMTTLLDTDITEDESVEIIQIRETDKQGKNPTHSTTIKVQMSVDWVLKLFELTIPWEITILSEVFPDEAADTRSFMIDEEVQDIIHDGFLKSDLGVTNNDELQSIVSRLLDLIEQFERPESSVNKSEDWTRSEISTKWFASKQRIPHF